MTRSKARTSRRWGILPLLLSLWAGLCACDSSSGADADGDGKAVLVTVVRPERGEVVRRITLPGTVRANFEVTLYAKTTGYVKSIVKDRGDTVKKGEQIAVLDIPEMQLDLERARADLHLKDATLKRLEKIREIEKTAVTDQDLDVARAEHAIASAALSRLEALAEYADIRAPFDGMVTERFVDPGALVQKGRIVKMVDAARVRILVDVPETDLRFVGPGTRAVVRTDALPGREFEADVTRLAGSLETETRTMRVELEIANPERAIAPGMSARVVFDLERKKNVLVLPGRAVMSREKNPSVYVNRDGRAENTPIVIGVVDGSRLEVASGLKDEDVVILSAGEPIREGMRVEVHQGNGKREDHSGSGGEHP
ncbi:MAG: efflux RND transporter periplasmic adaptor subunit [Planctomycetota bacterium]|jgi:RND family efflux transporter MFP subunit